MFGRSRGGPTCIFRHLKTIFVRTSQVRRRYQRRKELWKNFTTGFLHSHQQRSGLFSHYHGCQYNWNPTDLDCKATRQSVEGDHRWYQSSEQDP
ncbi:hypothetical protein T12_767 [Trichinella patagoniensis]|uniref:Uncharacterized protein n=1 Tax=Trichinella patagoniensis TaxID=990121 RepID=A0A0V0ZWL4_9BILA|nr:hypothetical protein T12_767 [Trichinella patagoniensis]